MKVRFGMAATLGTLPDIEQFRRLLKLRTTQSHVSFSLRRVVYFLVEMFIAVQTMTELVGSTIKIQSSCKGLRKITSNLILIAHTYSLMSESICVQFCGKLPPIGLLSNCLQITHNRPTTTQRWWWRRQRQHCSWQQWQLWREKHPAARSGHWNYFRISKVYENNYKP